MHTELQSIMKQAHMLSKISLLAFAVLAFLTGCSSESTSTIEIPCDGTTSISINGNQFQVREGNVTYNGQKFAVPENSTLKITHNKKSVFIYADDKLVYEE
jgi:septal ring-binding cell division protein DamX